MEGMSSEIKIDATKIKINKGKYQTTFVSENVIFYRNCYDSIIFKLIYLSKYEGECKHFVSVEDFLNYFKIPFKDIV